MIAGTGSLSTDGAVKLAREAKELGADACLVIAPPYVRASQRGLYEHFRRVAGVGLPVMIYDNPGRAGVSLELTTIAELAKVPGIVALKDATDSVAHAVDVMARCDLPVVCGADNLALPMMACGAVGVMSILSNAAPSRVLAITKAVEKGDFTAAKKAHDANVSPSARQMKPREVSALSFVDFGVHYRFSWSTHCSWSRIRCRSRKRWSFLATARPQCARH